MLTQHSQAYLQRNARENVSRRALKAPVAAELRAIFDAPDRAAAEQPLAAMVARYQRSAPASSLWFEEAIPEGLTVFNFPATHRRRLRTTNGMERVIQELRRRTRGAAIFPNEASCLRLVSGRLMEQEGAWMTGRLYLRHASSSSF